VAAKDCIGILSVNTEDCVLAAVIVGVTTAAMRLLYGYWPWQRPSRAEAMRQDVEATFRETPPFQPFSETPKEPPRPTTDKPDG